MRNDHKEIRRRRTGARGLVLLLLPTLLLNACDTSNLLDVQLPGKVPEDALSDPELATTLVNGVISDLECSWNNYVAAAALHSDEFIHSSGNGLMRQWGQRRINADEPNFASGACADWGYGLYTPLQTARFQAEDVFKRLGEFANDRVPNKTSLQATARAYGAYALVAFGEGFCEAAFDGGPLMKPQQVLTLAEQRFSEAIQLAQTSNNADILNMAYAGRARVRLDLGNFQGAIADASRVPSGYVKNATRDGSDARRYNSHFEWVNGPNWKHASVAPNYRELTWKGVPDPRVRVATRGELGFDFVTPHFFHHKTTGRDTPVPLASYKEAQLIIAEAATRTGDLATALRIINERHQLAGIPPVEASEVPNQAAMLRQVLEERRRELFAEGGHRLNDMLRFRTTEFKIPFQGEPGSIHPNGIDHLGQPYGDLTCFPLPTIERQGNPSIKG